MKATKWLDLTKAAQVSKLSPHTLRRLANNTIGGKHAPLISHKREGADGRPSADGRVGKIMIDQRTARDLRDNPPTK
ncbi:MAG TPA: hypothetical protein VHY91_14435 [Pirellulales bacterium]|jgi:hypothetical protein|nr:hypothetical protein [Pirellulales bacterium]